MAFGKPGEQPERTDMAARLKQFRQPRVDRCLNETRVVGRGDDGYCADESRINSGPVRAMRPVVRWKLLMQAYSPS